jgi:hypothetical protein
MQLQPSWTNWEKQPHTKIWRQENFVQRKTNPRRGWLLAQDQKPKAEKSIIWREVEARAAAERNRRNKRNRAHETSTDDASTREKWVPAAAAKCGLRPAMAVRKNQEWEF